MQGKFFLDFFHTYLINKGGANGENGGEATQH